MRENTVANTYAEKLNARESELKNKQKQKSQIDTQERKSMEGIKYECKGWEIGHVRDGESARGTWVSSNL